MQSKVFILRDNIKVAWDKKEGSSEMRIIPRGNLDELNKLLGEGWVVESTIELKQHKDIQSILYNLKKPRKASAHKA